MDRKTLIAVTLLAIVAFIGFWLFLPFIIAGILLLSCVTLYKTYKPQTRLDSSGKAVFITGCDTGFGYMLAVNLDRLGYQVFAACLFPHKNGAQDLKSKCSKRLHIVPLDVTSERQVTRAVDYVNNNLQDNKLWAVVNNAGIAVYGPAEWTPLTTFEKVMSVNYTGTVRVTMAFLPLLRQSKGRLVNVSSLAGRGAVPGFSTYTPSKAAVLGFSDALRRELSCFGIRIITVEPALYRTAIADMDIHVNSINQSWNDLPDTVRSDYGQQYYDMFLKSAISFGQSANTKVEEVIQCISDAVTVSDPPCRYIPNVFTSIIANTLSFLPYWLLDKLYQYRFF